jgi:hypothetical protein
MTRRRKITLSILAILVLIIVTINIILFFGMTGMAKKYLPEIQKTTGFNIDFNRIWATLPGGTVKISGLMVNNPKEGSKNSISLLSVDHINANIGLFSLLRGIVDISSLKIENASLNIIRTRDGKFNAGGTGDKTRTGSRENGRDSHGETAQEQADTETGETPGKDQASSSQSAPAKASLGKVQIDTVVEYTDYKAVPVNGAKIRLNLKITADNISTFGDPDRETGVFSITGSMADKPDSFVIDIKGKIAPLINSRKPTFDIDGTIANIRTEDFKELADSMGVEIGRADIDLHVRCRKGSFTREASFVNATINNLQASGKLASVGKGASLSSATLSIPLKGTIQAPDFDPIGSILQTLTGNIDQITKALKSNKKIDKEINNFLDGILGGKKKK